MTAIRFNSVSKQFVLHRNRPRSFQELFLKTLHRERLPQKETYWALRDVSFEVKRGEMLGIIGANGAGKSTALKLISRIIEPTSGQIEINGQVGALLELGAGFHPDLTGRENVYLNGSILGFSRAKMNRIYDEIVEFSELERFIDVPVKHYSSGMYMRLAFSIAIHVEPEILLVDEILAVGDQSFQLRCLDKISEMKRQGVTIVWVTHSLDQVREMCNRAIWLDEGKILAAGQVGRVLEHYSDQIRAIDEQTLQQANADVGRVQDAVQPGDSTAEEEDAAEHESSWRWGTREAEIVRVQLLDGEGNARRSFRTGDTFVARMHYVAHQRIEEPLFGVALHHADGFHINGPNTGFADYPIEAIEGTGHIDFIIPHLPLLKGTFLFTAALYDSEARHAYDHHHMAYTFRVAPGKQIREKYGAMHIPSRWQMGGAAVSQADTPNEVAKP